MRNRSHPMRNLIFFKRWNKKVESSVHARQKNNPETNERVMISFLTFKCARVFCAQLGNRVTDAIECAREIIWGHVTCSYGEREER